MDVNDVVAALLQHPADFLSEVPAEGDSRLRSVAVDRLAATDADDVRLLLGARNVRGDDVDMMSAATSLAGEEMNVFADPTQVRVVVLRDQRNPQRLLVVRERK